MTGGSETLSVSDQTLQTVSQSSPDAGARRLSDVRLIRRDDFDRDVWCVMGAPIDNVDLPAALEALEAAVRNGERLSFVTPNVNWLVRALKDKNARRQIIDADLSLADGAPVAAMTKMLGASLRQRAAGSDLFDALRQRPALGRKLKVYFFGGRDGSAEAAYDAVNADRGGIDAVGWMNPGFGDVETMSSDTIIDEINAANPDFIVVSLGAAKGQDWIDHNQDRLNAAAIAHLGAVVDFAAGAVMRAPKWMAKSGLEWLWRIKADNGLWKRYAADGAALASLAVRRLPVMLMSGKGGQARARVAAEAYRTATNVTVALSGDLVHGALDPVRETFRKAIEAGVDVRLDFAAAGRLDGAFLGLVLMLEKHLTRRGAQIEIVNANPRMLRLFRANAMDYRIREDMGESIEAGAENSAAIS